MEEEEQGPSMERRDWGIRSPTLRQQGLRLRTLNKWQGRRMRELFHAEERLEDRDPYFDTAKILAQVLK